MESSNRPLKVLLIEDNRDFVFILSSLFNEKGFETVTAFTGAEGVKKAKDIKPDIIFCDIGLPEMNGFEVAKNIRCDAALQGVILIALSGYASPRDIELAITSGFDRHLSKPVDINVIMQILFEIQCLQA